METLAGAALLARQVACAYQDDADDSEHIGRGIYELAAALDGFARLAERRPRD